MGENEKGKKWIIIIIWIRTGVDLSIPCQCRVTHVANSQPKQKKRGKKEQLVLAVAAASVSRACCVRTHAGVGLPCRAPPRPAPMDGARRPDGRTHVDGGTQANRQDEIDWFFFIREPCCSPNGRLQKRTSEISTRPCRRRRRRRLVYFIIFSCTDERERKKKHVTRRVGLKTTTSPPLLPPRTHHHHRSRPRSALRALSCRARNPVPLRLRCVCVHLPCFACFPPHASKL